MAEATAPGKLLLTGEYAVLGGAPAVGLALGGPARARVEPAAQAELQSPAGGPGLAYRLDRAHGALWPDAAAAEQVALPGAVLTEALARWPDALLAKPLSLRLDTAAFSHQAPERPERKLGLGSSAALVVALGGALLRALGLRPGDAELRDFCLAAHRRFQGGRGSGVDVLTALHGGLVLCAGEARPLSWPRGLQLLCAWTGRSASTPELIRRYEAFAAARPAAFHRAREALEAGAHAAARAWSAGDAGAVLGAVADYARALREMDTAGELGIWTPEHQSLAQLAADAGVVYKTSGAGGGDLGFFLAPAAEPLNELSAAAAAAGFHLLAFEGLVPGLQVSA